MSFETSLPGVRTTVHAACQTGRRAGADPWLPGLRDSGRYRQAYNTLATQSAAATKPGAAPMGGERADDGADHHPERRGGRQPAERARAAGGRDGVRHIGLGHACGAAAGALDDAGEKQQPHALGQAEDHVRGGRGGEADQQRRTPAVVIGDPAPQRRRHQLRDGKGGDDPADRPRARLQVQRVEREQRQHHREADHVHAIGGDEREQAMEVPARGLGGGTHPRASRRAPRAKTTALASIRKTPLAAATPTSPWRRLARISREMGRVS